MPTEKYSFWDSFAEALEPLDDATYGRIVRAMNHKVFAIYGNEDPDFSDNPILSSIYMVMMRNSEESRDMFKAASENGKKARGVPKKRNPKGGLKGGLGVPKANRKEMSGEEAIASSLHSYTGAMGPGADAPDPAPYPYPTGKCDEYDDEPYPTPPPPPEP